MAAENPVRLLVEALLRHRTDPCCVDDAGCARNGFLNKDDGVPMCRIVCYCRKACGLPYEHALKLAEHSVEMGVAAGVAERRGGGRVALVPELARKMAPAAAVASNALPTDQRELRGLLEALERRQQAWREAVELRARRREAEAAAAAAAAEQAAHAVADAYAERAAAAGTAMADGDFYCRSTGAEDVSPFVQPIFSTPTLPPLRRGVIFGWAIHVFIVMVTIMMVIFSLT